MIVDLIADGLGDFRHILGDRVHYLQVILRKTETLTDSLKLVCASRILTTRHGCCQVVADDDGDICILIDGIEQTCHTRVSEGRVTDNCYGRPLTCIRGTLRHRDRSTHIHTRMDGLIRWQETEGIATNIAEYAGIGILLQNFVQSGIDITVTTTLTKCRRTRGDILARCVAL